MDADRYDLGKLLADHDAGPKVDLSGRPKPVGARVILNSGLEVKCDVRFDGIDTSDNTRRYLVIAELDWENYWPVALLVDECPKDVGLIFRSNCEDSENQWRATNLRVIVDRWI